METVWFAVLFLALGLALLFWGPGSLHDNLGYLTAIAACIAAYFLWRYSASELPPPIVAGSRWVGSGKGRKAHTVRHYELTKISTGSSFGYDGSVNAGRMDLHLHEGPNLILAFDTAMLEVNPELWALVYNGIRHSVANGATISRATRERLLIDPPPLDQPDQ